eukprot:727293-Rhodomonas_salina.2
MSGTGIAYGAMHAILIVRYRHKPHGATTLQYQYRRAYGATALSGTDPMRMVVPRRADGSTVRGLAYAPMGLREPRGGRGGRGGRGEGGGRVGCQCRVTVGPDASAKTLQR